MENFRKLISLNTNVVLARKNLNYVADLIDKLNTQYNGNLRTNNMLFHIFMRQHQNFHKRLACDLLFITNDYSSALLRFLDKEVLWLHLLKSDNFFLIQMWIDEQIERRLKAKEEEGSENQVIIEQDVNQKEIQEKFDQIDQAADQEDLDKIDQEQSKDSIHQDQEQEQKESEDQATQSQKEQNFETREKSPIHESFEEFIQNLFKQWELSKNMVDQLSRYNAAEKDIILNGLASLGLFIPKEEKNICRHLQRIFVSQTIEENIDKIKKEDLHHFILENNLVDLLVEKELIDYDVLKQVAKVCNNSIKAEVELACNMKDLMEENDPGKLVEISRKTTEYLLQQDPNFLRNNPKVQLFEDLFSSEEFDKDLILRTGLVRNFNYEPFPNDLFEALKKYNGIDMSGILNEVRKHQPEADQRSAIPHFDHPKLVRTYGAKYEMEYLDYLKVYKTTSLAVYKFLLKDYEVKTEKDFIEAASRVAQMTAENIQDEALIPHSIAFIEMLGVDSSNFRKYLRYLRIKDKQETDADSEIVFDSEKIRDIEALYAYEPKDKVPKFVEQLAQKNKWYELVTLAEYLEVPRETLIDWIYGQFENKMIEENLLRALVLDKDEKKEPKKTEDIKAPMKDPWRFVGSSKLPTPGTSAGSSKAQDKPIDKKRPFKNGKFLHPKIHNDLFAVLLRYNVQNNLEAPKLDFKEFLAFHTTNDLKPENIFQLSIARKWPLLSILSAMVKTCPTEYCWTNYLMITCRYKCEKDFKTLYELVKDLCSYCIINDRIEEFHESLKIFYPSFSLVWLAEFMLNSNARNFELATECMKQFVDLFEENDDIWIVDYEEKYLKFCSELTSAHFLSNFHIPSDILKLLNALCASESYFLKTNFHYLLRIFEILKSTKWKIDFNWMDFGKYNQEMCEKLVIDGYFDEAIQLAAYLKLEKSGFVYQNWKILYGKEKENFDFNKCLQDLEFYHVEASNLVDFYLYVSSQLANTDLKQKYLTLKKALDAIKSYHLHPNPKYDRDHIEYELLCLYVKISDEDRKEIPIYHSEYYENVVVKNRNLIFHSFLQLKEHAQIEEIKINDGVLTDPDECNRLNKLMEQLLDDSDVVQVLRIQTMFDQRPIELNFLVFIFGLVEELTILTELPKDERSVINSAKASVAKKGSKYNFRWKIDESSLAEEYKSVDEDKAVFIENVLAIQGLIEIMNCGVSTGSRALLLYRAAHYTSIDYLNLLETRDVTELLRKVSNMENCPKKFMMIHDMMAVHSMSSEEISEFLAAEIFKSISLSRFDIDETTDMNDRIEVLIKEGFESDKMWGFSLEEDFHLFLELIEKSSLLGDFLLLFHDMFDYYKGRIYSRKCAQLSEKIQGNLASIYTKLESEKKQNTMRVELLIKAHECYVKECAMEGIGNCLEKARELTGILTNSRSFNLIVRLLYGIGRYREMYYCFDILIKNEQFELLLGQFSEKYNTGLKNSLINYLTEYHPDNKEFYNMTIYHFRMNFEIAQKWENEANSLKSEIVKIEETLSSSFDVSLLVPHLPCTKESFDTLNEIMEKLTHAAEFYLHDNKLEIAQKITYQAELIALQISFVRKQLNSNKSQQSYCISFINIQSKEIFKYFANYELNVLQAGIMDRAYAFEIDWKTVLFIQFVKRGNVRYLQFFMHYMDMTDQLVEGIAGLYQKEAYITKEMEKNMMEIVNFTENVVIKFKLASKLGFKGIVSTLMNSEALYYLKDTEYGKTNI